MAILKDEIEAEHDVYASSSSTLDAKAYLFTGVPRCGMITPRRPRSGSQPTTYGGAGGDRAADAPAACRTLKTARQAGRWPLSNSPRREQGLNLGENRKVTVKM
jgi:hypothetical protein